MAKKELTLEQEAEKVAKAVHKAIGKDKKFILIVNEDHGVKDSIASIHNMDVFEAIGSLEVAKQDILNGHRQ